MKASPRPSRNRVLAVIGSEAMRANVHADDVINITRVGRLAAFRAMRRIVRETNCSANALAEVWGCEASTVTIALREGREPDPAARGARGAYDASTTERLRWAHGEARAAQIVAGHDPRTNQDLASWRRIGAHGLSLAEFEGEALK